MNDECFKEFIDRTESPWKASKNQVLTFWQNLQVDLPIQIEPIPVSHKGRRYDVDGIRLTGSQQFIASVLSRIKELLRFEMRPGTKLDVDYRQIRKRKGPITSSPRYVCYVHVVQDKAVFEPKFAKPKKPRKN